MSTQNRMFDDLARMAGGALGAASGLREEIEGLFRQQLERVLQRMDVVSREEFEAVKAMAAKARDRQEELETRLAVLEGKLAVGDARPHHTPPRASSEREAGGPSA